jgi:hypothetical protein
MTGTRLHVKLWGRVRLSGIHKGIGLTDGHVIVSVSMDDINGLIRQVAEIEHRVT